MQPSDSTSNTPRTQALVNQIKADHNSDVVAAVRLENLASQLETELNEALAALSGRTVSCSQCNETAAKLKDTEAELSISNDERDHYRRQAERVIQERDELKVKYDSTLNTLEATTKANPLVRLKHADGSLGFCDPKTWEMITQSFCS